MSQPFVDDGGLFLLAVRCPRCQRLLFPPQRFGCEACGAHGEALRVERLRPVGRTLRSVAIGGTARDEGASLWLAEILLEENVVVRAPMSREVPDGTRVEGTVMWVAETERLFFRPAVEDR